MVTNSSNGFYNLSPTYPMGYNSALSFITPFTHRTNISYSDMLFDLYKWLRETHLPELDKILEDFKKDYLNDIGELRVDIQKTKDDWQALFDKFMADVRAELTALNDPIVADLIKNLDTLTHEAIQEMLLNETRPLVNDLVADAIANDSTIVETANNAVGDAVERLDIITGEDTRAMKTLSPDIRWAIPFTDNNGEVAGGFTKQGIFETMTVPALFGDFIRGVDTRSMIELSPDSPWAFAVADSAGNVIMGVRKDGGFFTADGGATTPQRTMIACKGDSMVRGYTNSEAWPLSDSWPNILNGLLPDVEVVNAGYGGRTIDEVRFLVGEDALWIDAIDGGLIPASGSASATVNRKIGAPANLERTFYGYIQGVNVYLTKSETGVWTVTRVGSGDAIPFTKPEILKRDLLYPSSTTIIWAGRNDVNYDVIGNEESVLEHMKTSMREWVSTLPGRNPNFVIVSVVNQTAEVQGSPRYNTIISFNDWVKAEYPGRYIEIRKWLINEAMDELGMEKTPEDISAISNDAPPPSIMDGGSHYTKPVAPLLANIFKNWVLGKGYV